MVKLNQQQRIFLLGATGVGKTVVGRGLARILAFRFYDIDSMIEQRSGVDLPWIIEVEGNEGVSKREHKILTELSHQQGMVVATGSQIVLNANNRKLLTSHGIVIHLQASYEQRCQRLHKRYKMLGRDMQSDLLVEEQELIPYYAKLADFSLNTDNLSYQAIADQLVKRLTSYLAA